MRTGQMNRFVVLLVIGMFFAVASCRNDENKGGAGRGEEINIPPIPEFIQTVKPNGKKLLIHYKTSFEHDDSQGCVAFNVVFAGVAAGYDVEMLYDAAGVYDLKVESDGRPHSYGYAVPAKLKTIMSQLYPVSPDSMPTTYRDYLYWLHKMGVRITYNGFMANLVSLQEKPLTRSIQIEKIAEPISLAAMLQDREAAALYVVY